MILDPADVLLYVLCLGAVFGVAGAVALAYLPDEEDPP